MSENASELVKPLQVPTLVAALLQRAQEMPDAPAFGMDAEILSFGKLREDAAAIAWALGARGVRRGDRCLLVLPTGLDFVRAVFAVQMLGAAPAPLNPVLPVEQLLWRAESIQCRVVITSAQRLDAFSAAKHGLRGKIEIVAVEDLRAKNRRLEKMSGARFSPPQPDDPAVLLFTSGTSGESRAAVILHRNLMASMRSGLDRLRICAADVLVNWAPLYNGLGIVRFVFCPVFFGCPAHFVPSTIAHLNAWLRTISRVRGTITGAPDFAFRAANELARAGGIDLRSLRFAISSGEAIRVETIRRFEEKFGVPGAIRPVYGLSESNGVTSLAPGEPLRVDAAGNVGCGKPVLDMRVEIVDENDRAQPPRVPGEIRLRGPQVFAGYFGDEEATKKKLRDGWFYTGDIGVLDEDGHLFVLGRTRALIKRGGAMIAPRDAEDAAQRVAGVLAAAAFGVERESRLGSEEVVVVAEIGEKYSANEEERERISRAIAEEISRALGFFPMEILLAPPKKIPRTANGKVRHEEIKRMFCAGELSQ